MGLIADAVNIIMSEAGKTSAAERDIAERRVRSALKAINAQINMGVLRVSHSFAVTSGTSRYVLPDDYGTMTVIGKYDSAGDRISQEWQNLGDYQATKRYESLMVEGNTGTVTHWMLDTPTTGGNERIRLFPTPDSSFTGRAIYFAKLTEQNVDRMDWLDPLIDGAKRKLSAWFPVDSTGGGGYIKAEIDFANDIKILKAGKTGRVMSPIRPHPEVVRANYRMRTI
jgi:hypothetical protein